MSGADASGVPPEEAEVDASDDRIAGAGSAPLGPSGADLTSATAFAPGLAAEATGAEEQPGALE